MKVKLTIFAIYFFSGVIAFAQSIDSTDVVTGYPGYGGSYYAWGRGNDGWGHCYQYASTGDVLNQGSPVSDYLCETVSPSMPTWGRGNDGWGHCYLKTSNDLTLNSGSPIENYRCESYSPSIYRWGRANNGYTYCYQYTTSGLTLNQGSPVPNNYCY